MPLATNRSNEFSIGRGLCLLLKNVPNSFIAVDTTLMSSSPSTVDTIEPLYLFAVPCLLVEPPNSLICFFDCFIIAVLVSEGIEAGRGKNVEFAEEIDGAGLRCECVTDGTVCERSSSPRPWQIMCPGI